MDVITNTPVNLSSHYHFNIASQTDILLMLKCLKSHIHTDLHCLELLTCLARMKWNETKQSVCPEM